MGGYNYRGTVEDCIDEYHKLLRLVRKVSNPYSVVKSSIQLNGSDKLKSVESDHVEYISEVSDSWTLKNCKECYRLVVTDSVFDVITVPHKSNIKCKCMSFNIASLQFFVDFHCGVSKVTLMSVQTVEVHLIDCEVDDTVCEYVSSLNSIFPNIRDISFMTKNISSSNACKLLTSHKTANTNSCGKEISISINNKRVSATSHYFEVKDACVSLKYDNWISIKCRKLSVDVSPDNFIKLQNGKMYLTQFEAVIVQAAFLKQKSVIDDDSVADFKKTCTIVFDYNPSFSIVKSGLLTQVPLTLIGHRVKVEITHRKQLTAVDEVLNKCNSDEVYLHIASVDDFSVLYTALDTFVDKRVVAFTMVFESVYFRPQKFILKFADCLSKWTRLREVVFATNVMPYKYEFRHLDDDKKNKIIDFIRYNRVYSSLENNIQIIY